LFVDNDFVVGVQNFEPLRQNRYQRTIPKSIGSIIRGFKIGVTKWFRQNTSIYNVWQRNYYEHIIRSENELNHIREYIISNPLQWQYDIENTNQITGRGEKFFSHTENQWQDFEKGFKILNPSTMGNQQGNRIMGTGSKPAHTKKVMRIGMILDHKFPPDMRVENKALALVKNGHRVFILSYNFNKLPSHEKYKGIDIIRITINKKYAKKMRALTNTIFNLYPHYWAKKIIKFVEKNKIEVLHIHDLYMLGAGFIANRRLNLPLIADLHENYVEGLKHYRFANSFPGNILISIPKWERKEVEWCNKANYLITVIEEAVERYKSLGIPEEKITVVANCVNQHEFLSPIKLGAEDNSDILQNFKDKFVVTYIGGFDVHRGLESIIRAIPKVLKKCPNLKIALVGKGKNLKALVRLSQNLEVEKYISFEGWQPPSKLPSYIKASDICLIPHLKTVHTDNTIPHKLFHYMLLERPIVATNCNPIERIINESKCGLIYESNDSNELAECIIKLYKDSELREQMGKNGKKAVLEKYNWENTSKNLVELYEEIEKSINKRR
jgi:glycosyltransferase involved in cell wall biosynthesis